MTSRTGSSLFPLASASFHFAASMYTGLNGPWRDIIFICARISGDMPCVGSYS